MPIDIDDLETPVPLVDLDRLDRNLDRAARYAQRHALALRPHVKTHKSPVIAERQLRLGASGLTCATPRELEVMSGVGHDLLLAYPAIGEAMGRRVLSLPHDVTLTVALDSCAAVEALASAATAAGRVVRVYVEFDVGMHRVGVPTVADGIEVIAAVRRHSCLQYAGITFYPGHIREPVTAQDAKLDALDRCLTAIISALADADLRPAVVSGGSTPTMWRTHELRGVTEFRPGTYVYNDRTTVSTGACGWEDCALTILATVVSTTVPGQAVVDAGTKALGREPMRGTEGEGYGTVLDRPDIVVERMSEEHGVLDLRATTWRPRVGERIRIIPNHVCVAVQLHETVHGLRGDVIETAWPVAARGRSRAPS